MIHVVLDANALRRDRFFSRHASRLLVREAREGRIRLVIPEVVFDEAINLYREDVSDHQVKIIRATQELGHLRADSGIDVEPLVVSQPLDRYREFLLEIIAVTGAYVAPYPATPHVDIVGRALRRDRPFDPEGKDGYRDTLIWETIKELAQHRDDQIIFVSADPKAFSPSKDATTLHRNLRDELEGLGIQDGGVIRIDDVKVFTDEHVPDVEPERLEIEHRIATEPRFRNEICEQIATGLRNLTVDQPMEGTLPVSMDVEVDQVGVNWVEEVGELRVLSAKPFDEDVLIELAAEATIELDLRVRKSDAPFLGDDIYIEDAHFNESFVRAGTVAQVDLEVEAIYRGGELQVVAVPEYVFAHWRPRAGGPEALSELVDLLDEPGVVLARLQAVEL